jgi:hypothetical protein
MSRSNPRRSTPLVDPGHLRDHADEARIARVWERLERNLQPMAPARQQEPARARRWAALAVAAGVGGLVAGVGIGRGWHDRSEGAGSTPLVAAADTSSPDVFAAGASRREYALPGGGRIVVMPGTIVDTKSDDGRGLALRLRQGEASLSTEGAGGADRSTPLSLEVGSAEVVTKAGELHVTRRGEVADVEVLLGSADVTSPDAELGVKRTTLRSREGLTVPLHLRTAEVVAPVSTARQRSLPPREGERPTSAPVAPVAGGWRERCAQGDSAGAYELLGQQPGGGQGLIATASASDLWCISDAYRKKDNAVVMRALDRLARDFPSSKDAEVATLQVARLLEQAGNPEQARIYYDRYRGLWPDAAFAQDALCQMILAAAQTGDGDGVARLGQEYLAKYPNGVCVEDIKSLLVESPAADGGTPGADRSADAGAHAVDGGAGDAGAAGAPGKSPGGTSPATDAGAGAPTKR